MKIGEKYKNKRGMVVEVIDYVERADLRNPKGPQGAVKRVTYKVVEVDESKESLRSQAAAGHCHEVTLNAFLKVFSPC